MEDVHRVQEICEAPSISLGVLHHGKVIYRKSLGLRDVEGKLEADSDTSYPIASCSKMLTSTAIGILAEDRISWNDTIREHLPDFSPVDDTQIGEKATIIDACRHSTGLANPNVVFLGPEGTILVKGEDHTTMVNALPASNEHGPRFQSWWNYSNAVFGLLANVVESVSGAAFPDFVRRNLCDPLGMDQTLLTESDVLRNFNVAHPYVRKADGTWARIRAAFPSDKHAPGLACTGMRSSVNDLLAFCSAVMDRYDVEQSKGEDESGADPALEPTGTPQNPLRQISSLWGWWWSRPINDGFPNDTAYTLGWLRTTMPTSALGMLSYNSIHEAEHIIGKQSEPRTIYGHNGIANGSVATAYVIPESHSAVVVLSNAASTGDAAETTSQLLLQALFDLQPPVDLIPSLQASRDDRIEKHADMVRDWESHRDVASYHTSPEEVLGTYVGLNVSHIHIIKSAGSASGLAVVFADQEASRCELEPYNADSLSFLPTEREEILARGMIDWDYWSVGIFDFVREDEAKREGPIVGLRWKWDEWDYAGLWVKLVDGMDQEGVNEVLLKHGRFLKKDSGAALKTEE